MGPYRVLIVNITDFKSATEGYTYMCTREHYNEGNTHFLYRPANLESLKILFASSCALYALGSRIWLFLDCVNSSKSLAEALAYIGFY